MRAALPLLALASLVIAAPLAVAHGGGEFPHVNPLSVTLAPGQNRTLELTFEENMTRAAMGNKSFEAGWVFILNAVPQVGGAPMVVELRPGHNVNLGDAVATWTITAPAGNTSLQATTVHAAALMPVTDVYSLVFRHGGGTSNATLTFFYDQTCNCAGKPIPVEVPNGLVVFNADVKKGATWMASFPKPPVHDLKVTLATRSDLRSRWPEDFAVLQTKQDAVARDVARLYEVTWTAEQDGRHYFFVESTKQDLSKFNPRDPIAGVMVTPFFEQQGAAAPQKTPLGAEVALLAVGLAAVVVGRRR